MVIDSQMAHSSPGSQVFNRQSSTPLHLQLEEVIMEKIANEEWRPNAQIPSENELSVTYGLSRMTTRLVITRLVLQGLLSRVPGKGTFVAAPKIANRAQLPMGIQRQLDEQGVKSDIQLLSLSRCQASGHARRQLRLERSEMVWKVERLRTLNGEPLSVHLSYLPLVLCPDLDGKDLRDGQLRNVLERDYRLQPCSVEESVETALASERIAELLKVKPGFTLLQLQETSRKEDETPFEYCHVLFRGDKMKITFEFSQGAAPVQDRASPKPADAAISKLLAGDRPAALSGSGRGGGWNSVGVVSGLSNPPGVMRPKGTKP
jgi:GntR family transcriptional regulator